MKTINFQHIYWNMSAKYTKIWFSGVTITFLVCYFVGTYRLILITLKCLNKSRSYSSYYYLVGHLQVAARIGVQHSVIPCIWNRFLETNSVWHRYRSGRRWVINQHQNCYIFSSSFSCIRTKSFISVIPALVILMSSSRTISYKVCQVVFWLLVFVFLPTFLSF